MKIDTKSIVVAAVLIALTVALAPLMFVFMLPLLFTAATRGLRMSLFMGLAFGVTSYIYALFMPSIIALAFVQAPWIAIVPRIIVGLVAHSVYMFFDKIIKSKKKALRVLPYALCGASGALTNTTLIVTLLVLFKGNLALGELTIKAFVPIMLTYGAIELAFYTVIIPPLAMTVKRIPVINMMFTNPITPNSTIDEAQKES